MRKLGQALGYEAMSLYNHVANKDDLLDGILDLVLAEMEPPRPGRRPAPRSARSALSAHEALKRHPWAANMLMSPARIRPARIAYMDALLGLATRRQAVCRHDLPRLPRLDAHIIGFSLWASTHGKLPEHIEDARAWFERDDPGRDAPLPARARAAAPRRGPAPGRERVRVRARPAARRLRAAAGLALRELTL